MRNTHYLGAIHYFGFDQISYLEPRLEVLKWFDNNEDGTITFFEWEAAMQNLPKKSSSIRVHGIEDEVLAMILRQFAELLFNRIDVNGDGVLSGSELKESFKQRKHELQAKERARKASYEKRVKPIRSAWKFTKYSAWLYLTPAGLRRQRELVREREEEAVRLRSEVNNSLL